MEKCIRICIYGIVQGVGFRPFISRLADSHAIKGSVANRGSYVEVFAQGEELSIKEFLDKIVPEAPERSVILKIQTFDATYNASYTDFQIIESEHEEGDIFVSPDIATCPKCKAELFDPTNRRYMHPFINCTACGPRLTILDAMPYDRERTSMKEFPMCPECEREYTSPSSRRYDAQPVCCNDCGPEVYILNDPQIRGRDAITLARKAISDGKIIAIKGIGGFHLCCNAFNEAAVSRLRQLKHRPAKPFAVMMKSIETAERECAIERDHDKITALLDGPQKPIILLKKSSDSRLAPSVAPDNPKVGVMLPYAPIQMLLFDYNDGIDLGTDTLVMTSGNLSGAPICRTDEDANNEISKYCDLILSHNRKIRLRADDSVTDWYDGEPYMIRRSRGYAPLPVMTEKPVKGCVLAIGGELKNTFCIAKNSLYYPSPYVGDMADIKTVNALRESIVRMEDLLEAKPEAVVCDMHPLYNTKMVAEEQGLPCIEVQHHYAHILSCMAENDFTGPVIGLSLDGTGYGTDGTIWGGEILKADADSFERLGSIAPFLHVGGDIASKEGWRIAVSMLTGIWGEDAQELIASLNLCDSFNASVLSKMTQKRINAVTSTSCGRLFDAVSAILGVRRTSTFEGEASTTLQFRAESYRQNVSENEILSTLSLHPELSHLKDLDGRFILPTDELVKYIAKEYAADAQCRLAYEFHAILAVQLNEAALKAREITGLKTVALSGGVFQNTLLLELTETLLKQSGFSVLRHRLIPPNDGGICLGQALAGMHKINN